MILVDIYIAALDRSYDFQVDETVPTENVTLEIAEMVENITRTGKKVDGTGFLLCSMDRNKIFSGKLSLQENGVINGSHLMLV
ncbi:MAG: EsaB/YukD family protein [Eubacteriales bacterium]|nr:EsaB/YukD family protein [Eubacteriales bacterium]